MSSKIVLDENKSCTFDFSKCEYILEFHDLANKLKLNDVDFITELNDEIIFIEYKNSNIEVYNLKEWKVKFNDIEIKSTESI